MPDSPFISIPDAARFGALARRVFASGKLTNNGDLVLALERRLAEYLSVPDVVLTSSGTLALQIAYRALGLTGEVITTPFSWVTTASSLCWANLRPRFVDVDPQSFNLDAQLIQSEASSRTSAVLAVHVFGNPGDLDAIEMAARDKGLATVYDAAHAFGVRYGGQSVFTRGDASILSLHATKVFHTVEGGAVILRDPAAQRRARLLANNGMNAEGEILEAGINGRMSELHAAVGLCLLDDIDATIERRARLAESLRTSLAATSVVQLQRLNPAARVNHTFFPIVFPTSGSREEAMAALGDAGYAPRRYFAPSLNQLPFLGDSRTMPVAEDLSRRILCVSLGTIADVERIANVINRMCPRPGTSLQVAS